MGCVNEKDQWFAQEHIDGKVPLKFQKVPSLLQSFPSSYTLWSNRGWRNCCFSWSGGAYGGACGFLEREKKRMQTAHNVFRKTAERGRERERERGKDDERMRGESARPPILG